MAGARLSKPLPFFHTTPTTTRIITRLVFYGFTVIRAQVYHDAAMPLPLPPSYLLGNPVGMLAKPRPPHELVAIRRALIMPSSTRSCCEKHSQHCTMSQPQPAMIETRWDPDSSRPFTIDHKTQTTIWASFEPQAASTNQAWERRIDAQLQKEFYYNVNTKELSWTLPQKLQSHM